MLLRRQAVCVLAPSNNDWIFVTFDDLTLAFDYDGYLHIFQPEL